MSQLLETTVGLRQFYARYTDAVWRKDYDAYGNCWTDDAQWLIAGQVLSGRPAIVRGFTQFMDKYHCVLFTPREPLVHMAGGEVSARTYVTEQGKLKSGGSVSSIATYFERFVEADGVWRRRWAFLQLHFMGSADFEGTFFEQPDFGPPPAMPPLAARALGQFPQSG
jgi:ketosteroid isomerase-like protein